MEAQLQNIFDDEMQRKRIFKCTLLSTAEISSFTSHEELKLLLDHRMTYIRREQLIFHMSLKNAFLSKFKIDQSICPLGLKMVYTKNYPYQMPRLYFVSENINQVYTVVGRDYFREVCPNWSAKVQLSDMLPLIAAFLERLMKADNQHLLGAYHRAEFIEMEPLYTFKSCEFYPIQIVLGQRPESAFLIINRFDFILLEASQTINYLRLIDAYCIASVKSIHRSKRTDKKIVVLLKLAKEEYALQFLAEDHENIVESLILKKKNAPVFEDPAQEETPKTNFFESEDREDKLASAKLSLEELNEEIMIYQSLLQRDFSDKVVNNLIMLYKKAIEFCSSTNASSYKLYLDKLQDLLSNEAVQTLINSAADSKKSEASVFFDTNYEEKRPSTAATTTSTSAKPPVQESIDLL